MLLIWVLALATLANVLPFLVSAHTQMHDPYPINSQEDPDVDDNLKDYTYTSPLNADGSNFPCKGHHKQETSHVSKATYKAGGTGKMTIKSGAVHGGGSCQISLSYDNGETWKVIKSMIGGCPVTLSYDFTIPQDAPSSKDVLLGWTWFNLVGNREMYMNCARVTIEGSAPGRHRRAQLANRQNAFSSLPDMFVCNVGQGCTTKENQNVVFPNPGEDVIEGENSMTTNPGNGFNGESAASGGSGGSGGSDGSGGSGGSGGPTPTPPAPAPPAPAPASASSVSPPFPNGTDPSATSSSTGPTSSPTTNVVIPVPAAQPSAAAPVPAPAPASGSCTTGSIVCNSPTTWSMCVGGALTSMGSVAAGTTCVDGKII